MPKFAALIDQMVHHDIWDYDTPMAPNLLDLTVGAERRKVIAQATKQGWLYVFDRATGDPIWPIVETPVMQSEVQGEIASPTQPKSDLIDYTPAIKEAALKIAKSCRMGPYDIPPLPGRRHRAERPDVLVVCARLTSLRSPSHRPS